MSKVEDSYKQDLFFGNLRNYKKITNKMPKVDHVLFGENDKKRMLKVISGKVHLLGNTKNNHFIIKDRKDFKKNKFNLVYIKRIL